MVIPLLLALSVPPAPPAADVMADAPRLAARIDELLAKHWRENQVQPAAPADDATFLRRLTLDLAGRVPTAREARAFAADTAPDRRARATRRLLEGPEFALHFGRVLDEMIQGKFAGDGEFLDYLRTAVAERRPWDAVFREVLLGPWDTPEKKKADRFLLRRLASLDDLTNDTARAFFGVNVSCAKCHNHPLVPDWTQDHYFGMASFFNHTQVANRGKARSAAGVMETGTGDVTFVTTKGERRTAKIMFLSGRVVDEPKAAPGAPPFSRRSQLVRAALEEKTFFSRAIVNRLWAYFLGRGLVHPVDQMHSANPPSVEGVLEWLADDLAAHGYDLHRLVAGLVSSRAYQLAGPKAGADPGDRHFAAAALRPLTPQQFALSLVLATGDDAFDQAVKPEDRARRYRELEGRAGGLTRFGLLDPRSDRFQSSAGEALFMSNNEEVQKLVRPAPNNLVARLAALTDTRQLVETAVWAVLSRPPDAEELTYLGQWVEGRKQDRAQACGELAWALLTSAEFRFNH